MNDDANKTLSGCPGTHGAALLLRLWGIGFGLPQEYHIDEHFYYPFAWSMGQGQLALPINPTAQPYLGLLLIGRSQCSWLSSLSYPMPILARCAIRIRGPIFSRPHHQRAAGALTIPIVYLLARRFRDRGVGIVAAAFLTVLFFTCATRISACPIR